MAGSALDEHDQFEKEVAWCITALRKTLRKTEPSRSELKEALKVLPILESSKSPVAKKRMAMRNALGDYRAKMAAEDKALAKQLLNGSHKFAEFDEKARPSPDARALNIHKSPTCPPAPPPSVSTSPAKSSKSSKSSTPSPVKPFSASPKACAGSPSASSVSSLHPSARENCSANASMRMGQSFAFNFDVKQEGDNEN